MCREFHWICREVISRSVKSNFFNLLTRPYIIRIIESMNKVFTKVSNPSFYIRFIVVDMILFLLHLNLFSALRGN